MLEPTPRAPWPLPALLLAALLGWAAIGWLASARLARRRGLTLLAAALDPRAWLAEPVLGLPARVLLLAWAVAVVAAAALVR